MLSDRIGRVRSVASALAVTAACALLFVVFPLLGNSIIPLWPADGVQPICHLKSSISASRAARAVSAVALV
jgi:hypothetical protein